MGIKTEFILDGSTPIGVRFVNGTESFDSYPSDYPANVQIYLPVHGLKQKIVDAGAMSKGATDAERFAAMRAMHAQLRDGDWTKRAEGAGTMLVRAVAEWSGQSVTDVRTSLEGKDAAFLKAIAAMPEVKAILDRMATEKPVPESAKSAAAAFLAGLAKAA